MTEDYTTVAKVVAGPDGKVKYICDTCGKVYETDIDAIYCCFAYEFEEAALKKEN